MKKTIVLFLMGFLLIAGNALAHCGKCGVGDSDHDGAHNMVTKKVNKMAAELGLSDEQKAQIEAIMLEKKEKKQQIWDEKKASMESLSDEYTTKIKGVLTEEQMAKWEAARAAKGSMKAGCPMCKDGKKCEMCEKASKGACPLCKDGKKCEMCEKKMKMKKEMKMKNMPEKMKEKKY
jgi:hypothetical protein